MENHNCQYKQYTKFSSLHWNLKIEKYLYGITLIKNTKADLEKKVDEFINDKIDFNNTHIIKSNIQPVSNVPELARFISSMTPIGSRND